MFYFNILYNILKYNIYFKSTQLIFYIFLCYGKILIYVIDFEDKMHTFNFFNCK